MSAVAGNEPRAWSNRFWWSLTVMVLLAQLTLILIFGAKKPTLAQPVSGAPTLELAGADDEYIALNDPTLFALPQAHDFGAAERLSTPSFPLPSFRWKETPRWLPITDASLLNAFNRFMRTNSFAGGALDFKPEPTFSEPPLQMNIPRTNITTMTVRGELGRRPMRQSTAMTNWLTTVEMTHWPEADVIAPSKVQVLVDAAGNVISATLLPPDSDALLLQDYGVEAETRDDGADRRAVELARMARFAPSSRITVGQLIFYWDTVASATTTNNTTKKMP